MSAVIRNVSSRRLSVTEEAEDLNFQRHLSKFQIEKFTYMFNSFFDHNGDSILVKEDIEGFLERMRNFRGFSKTDERYLKMRDVLFAFYDCMMDQVQKETRASEANQGYDSWSDALAAKSETVESGVNLNQWLNMWGRLCRGAAGITGFPFWVQLLAYIFFDAIDRDSDGDLTFDEIKNFYQNLVGVKNEDLERVSKEGFRVMTANNGYKLNRENYLFCFANFLLGRGIYGPGKYIFGVFDNREISETFKVKYTAEEDD